MKLRLATPALIAAGVLVFAACGGDDDSANSVLGGKSTTATTQAASNTTKTAAASATTTTEASSDTTASGSASSDTTSKSFSGSGSGAFCDYVRGVAKDFNVGGDLASATSGGDLKAQIQASRKVIDNAVGKAPSEIKSDVKTLSDFIGKYDALLAKYDYDVTKMVAAAQSNPQDFQQFEQLAENSDLETAGQHVDDYISQVCKVDISGG